MHVLFVVLVLIGFLFQFMATWPVTYAARIAWGCWLAASVMWALPSIGG